MWKLIEIELAIEIEHIISFTTNKRGWGYVLTTTELYREAYDKTTLVHYLSKNCNHISSVKSMSVYVMR